MPLATNPQAVLGMCDVVSAFSSALPRAVGRASAGSAQPQVEARAAPTPAMLERTIAAVISGDESEQRAILQGVPVTYGLLVAIAEVVESAFAPARLPLQQLQQQAGSSSPSREPPQNRTQVRTPFRSDSACTPACH